MSTEIRLDFKDQGACQVLYLTEKAIPSPWFPSFYRILRNSPLQLFKANFLNRILRLFYPYFSATHRFNGVINFMTSQNDKLFTPSYATVQFKTSKYVDVKAGKWKLRIEIPSSNLRLVSYTWRLDNRFDIHCAWKAPSQSGPRYKSTYVTWMLNNGVWSKLSDGLLHSNCCFIFFTVQPWWAKANFPLLFLTTFFEKCHIVLLKKHWFLEYYCTFWLG